MAKSVYDKPAEEWTEKEIEVERLRLEAHRTQAESSVARRYGAIILSAVATLVGTGATYYLNAGADARAHQEAREETERNLAQNAVRVYFDHPESFDLKTEAGKFNLRVLAGTAPGETTATLVSQIQDNAVQIATANAEVAAESSAAAVAATPGGAPATAAAPAPTNVVEARQVADNARYTALANAPAVVENASKPSDFKIYIQYGAGAAAQATETQKRLMDIGYGAPQPQLTTTATDKPELRYFLPSQAKLAEELAMQLKDLAGGPPTPKYFGEKFKLPDGIMELWLPPQGATSEQAFQQGAGLRKFRVEQRVQDIIRQEANKQADNLALARRSMPLGN
jgi:hypothetical protein